MGLLAIILGNMGILLMMTGLALIWNLIARLGRRRRVGQAIYAFAPSGKEWASYYWRRVRGYLLSYLAVMAILLVLRRGALGAQLLSFLAVLPGLALYFVLAGAVPPRFAVYPEGFSAYALIPFLPGRRDRESRIYSDFRVGFKPWSRFHDAIPRGDYLLLRGDVAGAELFIPHGQRDRLLSLAREGLKRAKEEKKQARKSRA
ncbi:MAG: hypothetical protein ACM3X6_09205 [Patescibacteria group bacterium]